MSVLHEVFAAVDRANLRPPRSRHLPLHRPRLDELLDQASRYPLTLVEAGAGYGKTTIGMSVADRRHTMWYTVGEQDRDPLDFVAHLTVAADRLCPGVLAAIEHRFGAEDTAATRWSALIDTLAWELDERLGEDGLCVLDDFDSVTGTEIDAVVERFVDQMPLRMNLLILTREHPSFRSLARWRATGDLFVVDDTDLTFTADEVATLTNQRFDLALSTPQLQRLTAETLGWPIAVQLFGQQARISGGVDAVVDALPSGREQMFSYLSEEVLNGLPTELADFLIGTACLKELHPDVCAAVTGRDDVDELLCRAANTGVLSIDEDGTYRRHPLIRDLLATQAEPERLSEAHRAAAARYRDRGDVEEAIHHAIAAGEETQAATDILGIGMRLLDSGRYRTILELTDRLGKETRLAAPRLLVHRSQALRLTDQFGPALAEARLAAEELQRSGDQIGCFDALSAEAKVHLDTLNPAAAHPPLDAMAGLNRFVDTGRRRRWQAMTTENLLNEGSPTSSETLWHRLEALPEVIDDTGGIPGPGYLYQARLAIRSGRLHDAAALLEAEDLPSELWIPRAHRDRDALRAWVYGMLGDHEQASRHAQRSLATGEELRRPLLTAIGTVRLGHAQLGMECGEPSEAIASYRMALDIAADIGMPQLRVEPLIGLAIAAARVNDLPEAWRCAAEARRLARDCGDGYREAMALLGFGVASATVLHPDAAARLAEARTAAHDCGDTYQWLLGTLWLSRVALVDGEIDTFTGLADEVLSTVRKSELDAVLLAGPWMGLWRFTDRRDWLRAAASATGDEYADYLLRRLESSDRDAHSTEESGLRISLLGDFTAERDGKPLPEKLFARRKAQELLWILCAREKRSIRREEAVELLWPDACLEKYPVRFRVTLHALNEALEPDREPRAPTRFVHATTDRISLDPGVWVDVCEFRKLARTARRERDPARALAFAEEALELYGGPFLEQEPYLEWANATREELHTTYVDLALWTAETGFQSGDLARATDLARVVIREDPYREAAYRLLAQSQLAHGDAAAARRVYRECRDRLAADLDVAPSWSPADLKPT